MKKATKDMIKEIFVCLTVFGFIRQSIRKLREKGGRL